MQPNYPQYPPQPPVPQYPTGYAYPPQMPQQYAPPVQAPTTPATLDTFYDQPSAGGGPAFKFMDANRQPMVGKTYVGIVARPVTNADVRPQTDQQGVPQTYRDGRPKQVMVVPMTVVTSPEFPEGVAGWWVKGQARDELLRAMGEAGAPAGPPEAGAGISVTLTGTRPIPGFNPQFIYKVVYQRPAGAAAVTAAPMPAAAPAPAAAVPAAQAAPAAPAPAQPALQAPSNLTTEQAALMAQLQGQAG